MVIDHRVVDTQPLLDRTVRTLTMEVRESDRHVSSGSSTRRVTVDPAPSGGTTATRSATPRRGCSSDTSGPPTSG